MSLFTPANSAIAGEPAASEHGGLDQDGPDQDGPGEDASQPDAAPAPVAGSLFTPGAFVPSGTAAPVPPVPPVPPRTATSRPATLRPVIQPVARQAAQAGPVASPMFTPPAAAAATPGRAPIWPVAKSPAAGQRPVPGAPGSPAAPASGFTPGAGGARPASPDLSPPDGVRIVAPAELRRASELLREDVAQLTLPLDLEGASEARRELNSLLSQLDDYLLPRLRRIDAPLLAVVGGSTGAGKSTLVNSLVRRFVTRSGVLRPTTRSPVLIHHPYDSGAFLTQRILPGFARVTSEAPEPQQAIDVDAPRATALRLVPDEGLAPGLAIIDAPDIDSLVETNRDLATQLLSAADLWIFVTTAARYSDAVPWDMLRKAVDRGVSVAVVLDRVPRGAMAEIRLHLAQLLRDRGLSTAPLFTIPESVKDADGFLPQEAVAPLHGWLSRLARDSRSRDVVVRRTLVGALDSLHERVRLLTTAAERQAAANGQLTLSFSTAFDNGERNLAASLGNGSLLRGEVLALWQEYVGTGDAFRGLDGTAPRLRDRVTAAVRGRPTPPGPIGDALRTGIHAAVATALRTTVERAVAGWRRHPAGPGVLELLDGGPAVSPNVETRIAHLVAQWQVGVLEQVRAEGQGRWSAARTGGLGAEGTAVVLMIVALGSTASTPGPIVEVARRVLRAVLGDQAEQLASTVHDDLARTAADLLLAERLRFARALARAGVRDDLAVALRSHLRAIEGAR